MGGGESWGGKEEGRGDDGSKGDAVALPMSGQTLGSAPSFFTSLSLSQLRSALCAYRDEGVAWVTRVVVTIPVDIPVSSASAKMDLTLLCSVTLSHFPLCTLSSTPIRPDNRHTHRFTDRRLNDGLAG